jgi:hypothetical protein
MNLAEVANVHRRIADDLCKDVQHMLVCDLCKKSERINAEQFASYLQRGWPRCCGRIMTLKSEANTK